MQVNRERGPVSFHENDRGAAPGESPVQASLHAAESRLQAGGAEGSRIPRPSSGNGERTALALQKIVAFETAEAGWLAAFSASRRLDADPEGGDRASEDAAWKAERAAASDFAVTPTPRLLDLPRKLALIEREAFEVAHNDACGKDLAVWIAALRLDLMQILAHPA